MSRCISRVLMNDAVFRCVFEMDDGHIEHQYNYYRQLKPDEVLELKAFYAAEEDPELENRNG